MPIPFIDAHHHLWQPQALDYGWLRDIGAMKPFGDPTAIQKDYLVAHFLADICAAQGVELAGSVHVQADGGLADPVAETSWLEAQKSHLPSAIVAFVDLSKGCAEETIQCHLDASARIRGIRQIIAINKKDSKLSFAGEDYLKNNLWEKNFSLLKNYNLSFDLQLYPEQMHDAADFLKNHTDIPVVIDHAGSPYDASASGMATWREGLEALAQLPQVMIKLSGFGMYQKNWSASSFHERFITIYDLFSADRIMWGSNFPVDSLMQSYARTIGHCRAWLSPLMPVEQSAILFDSAKRFYRI